MSDLISLPLPRSEKTLTAFWVKVCLLFSMRVRKPWSQPGDCRRRGSHFKPVPLSVQEVLLVIIVSYWCVQITPLFLAMVTVGIHMHGRDMIGNTYTHKSDLRKSTSHTRREVGELMHMPIMCEQTLVLQLIKTTDGLMRKQKALVWLYVEAFHSLHGFSQLSLKQRRFHDPPHTCGICQTDEPTPKIDCISSA